jgi:hypothetical protein
MDLQLHRDRTLRKLTNEKGVYALCDLDGVPIYIGQSTDGIRTRVRRHLTSARSDVIANRQLDIWEISEVWGWPLPGAQTADINKLEHYLIHLHNDSSPLVNGDIPPRSAVVPTVPDKQAVQIMPDEEIEERKDPDRRLPRQLESMVSLFSHILEVKNNVHQRRMLRVHFNRTKSYYEKFMEESGDEPYITSADSEE